MRWREIMPVFCWGRLIHKHRRYPHALRVADSSSRKAVNFSSACTTKRFLSPRCASATKIVRPLESKVATQPQLQPALLRSPLALRNAIILREIFGPPRSLQLLDLVG